MSAASRSASVAGLLRMPSGTAGGPASAEHDLARTIKGSQSKPDVVDSPVSFLDAELQKGLMRQNNPPGGNLSPEVRLPGLGILSQIPGITYTLSLLIKTVAISRK